jgi:hypothetical protein
MSFVMLTPKSKQKVKCLNEDGSEIYEDVDPYAFLRFQEAGLLRPAKKPKQLTSSSAVEGACFVRVRTSTNST